MASVTKGLKERLQNGETVLCAEGYLWELERRGFVKFGEFTPEVVLDYPERVTALHEEFALAGSDVIEAYTYYGHREKMRSIGREEDCRSINLKSLKLARDVANRFGKLMAGDLCNSTIFEPNSEALAKKVAAIFKEQVEWAVEGGADFIIGETFNDFQEAKIALEAIKAHGRGLPAVITIAAYSMDTTTDDVPLEEALRRLEDLGADVVGFNCGRGPKTLIPLLKKARAVCKGPLAALPVPLRTSDKEKTMQAVKDPVTGKHLYPENLSAALCTRAEIETFTKEALRVGVQYLGLCCNNTPSLFRSMAMASGRRPPLAKFSTDISKSFLYGDAPSAHTKKIRSSMCGEIDNNAYTQQ